MAIVPADKPKYLYHDADGRAAGLAGDGGFRHRRLEFRPCHRQDDRARRAAARRAAAPRNCRRNPSRCSRGWAMAFDSTPRWRRMMQLARSARCCLRGRARSRRSRRRRACAADSRAVDARDRVFRDCRRRGGRARLRRRRRSRAAPVAIVAERAPPRRCRPASPMSASPTRARRWRAPRRGSIRASPRRSSPSPAPAARPRSPPSRGRSGRGSALKPPRSARSASSRAG